MFDSKISAKALIDDLKDEIDVALEIPDRTYITFLNSLEQMLYADFIQEQNEVVLKTFSTDKSVNLSTLSIPDNEDGVKFEYIASLYANHNLQLIKTTPANGTIFPNCYYKSGNSLKYNTVNPLYQLRIVYIAKPKLKTSDNWEDLNVMIPIEFIELVKSKLRAESYMVMNEYNPASNQISIYNAQLSTFRDWLSNRSPQFG